MSLTAALLRRRASGSRIVFSPTDLFANGEAGVWYDPPDLTTLFQDPAGTTPVTTAGQTVALMLDKSQGLTLGPELVTNGTFDTDISGWTLAAGGLASVTDGVVTLTNDTSRARLSQFQTTVIGRSYKIILTGADLGNSGAGNPRMQFGSKQYILTNGVNEVLHVATGTNSEFVLFNNNTTSGRFFSVDDFSVKELPGYHATQPTAAARPTYQTDGTYHWLEFDGVDDFMVTSDITPDIDKSQMFVGARRLSDATAMLAETGPTSANTNGTIGVFYNPSFGYAFSNRGTNRVLVTIASGVSPISHVISGIGDITEDITTIRLNQSAATETGNLGSGGYSAQPLYIGRRVNGDFPFNGNIYSLVTRFGANLETSTIETTEAYVAGKTGVTL